MKTKGLASELLRRRVWPVIGFYLFFGAFLHEIALEVIVPALGLSDDSMEVLIRRAVLGVLVAGFPIAVALSWIFDITPDGIKRTLADWQREPETTLTTSNAALDTIVDTIIQLPPLGSVVVLPFANLSGHEDADYFGDGLTEDIIDSLAKVSSLRVVARTSSFVFKNKNEDIRDIGARLNVRYAVEGSVRQVGDKMRIVAQLIAVSDGYHVWSETFDRRLIDVFDTLDEISQAIALNLITLISGNHSPSTESESALITRHTTNLDAYHLYLKGNYFWNQRGDAIMKGMEYFQQAAAADARYALPYVGISDTYALLGYYGYMPPQAAFPLAKENAKKALSLNPSLAEAQTSLALVNLYFEWDWQAAEKTFLKAIELNPHYAPAQYWLSVLYTILQEPEKAIKQDKIALELDPVSPFVNLHHGWTLHCTNQNEAAIERHLKTIELNSQLWPAYQLLAYAYCEAGRYQDAIDIGELVRQRTGNNILSLPTVGYAHAKAGNRDKVLEIVTELESRSDEFFWPSHVASIYAELGDFESAFEWLEKAYDVRDHWLITMNVQPAFRAFHSHPDYREFTARIGLNALKKPD